MPAPPTGMATGFIKAIKGESAGLEGGYTRMYHISDVASYPLCLVLLVRSKSQVPLTLGGGRGKQFYKGVNTGRWAHWGPS